MYLPTKIKEKRSFYENHSLYSVCAASRCPVPGFSKRCHYGNYHKAFQYAEIAANSGIMEGEFVYANLLFWGRGCEADVNKAYEMYEKAYKHGMYQAKFMMEKIENHTI